MGRDPHIYSMYDLQMCKNKQLLTDLRHAVDLASQHVDKCQVSLLAAKYQYERKFYWVRV